MACTTHPGVDETRVCTSCEQRWCDACVVKATINGRAVCPSCGHLVEATAAPKTLAALARDLGTRVISREGFATSLAFAIIWSLSRMFAFLFPLYLAALVGYYFTIIPHVGDGKPGLPTPAESVDDLGATVTHILRGILCVIIGGLPVFVWILRSHRSELSPGDGTRILELIALGQLYFPAALLSVSFTNQTLALCYPVTWIKVISRAPGGYVRFLGLWFVTFTIGGLLLMIGAGLDNDSMGFALAFGFVWNLYGFAQAVLIGDFVRLNADAFRWAG